MALTDIEAMGLTLDDPLAGGNPPDLVAGVEHDGPPPLRLEGSFAAFVTAGGRET